MNLSPPLCPPIYVRQFVKLDRLAWLKVLLDKGLRALSYVRHYLLPSTCLYHPLTKGLSPPHKPTSNDVCPFRRARRRKEQSSQQPPVERGNV